MRVLIAPDKFKGTLTAPEATDAIARGVRRAASERSVALETDLCPVADGGEGTGPIVEAALQRAGAFGIDVPMSDLLGAPVTARVVRWKRDDGGSTTLIESGQVIGLARVPEDRRDPTAYTSAPLGRLLASLRFDGESRVLIALGGSATVDGGVGAATALGWRFVEASGEPAAADGPRRVGRVLRPDKALRAPITILCDVDNPLLGETGAARVYGPQKGATPGQVEQLERGLEHLVALCRGSGIACDPLAAGAGAAGGLGFGLAAFLGATLTPGAEYLLDLVDFRGRAARADVVLTGEGRLDAQTVRGKAPSEVARIARGVGRPVLAVVGAAEAGAAAGMFDSVTACAPAGGTAAERLADGATEAFRGWLASLGA